MPCLLMCMLTLLILMMDVSMPEMAKSQYQSYQSLFRAAFYVITLSGAAYYLILLANARLSSAGSSKSPLPSDRPAKSGTADQSSKSPMALLRPDMPATLKAAWLCMGAFIICIILSTAVNGLNVKAIHGVAFRDIGIFHIFVFILIFLGASSCIKSLPLRRAMLILYAVTADLIAIAVLFDRFVQPIAAFDKKKDISAIFFNGNHYGYFLVMAILISIGLALCFSDIRIRITGAVSAALNSEILIMNGSSGCLIAVITALLIGLLIPAMSNTTATAAKQPDTSIKKHSNTSAEKHSDAPSERHLDKRHILSVLVGIMFIFIVLAASTGMFKEIADSITAIVSGSADASSAGHNRWLLWTETFGYVMERPLLGYGCEGLSDILMDSLGRANPHNEILSYASQFGIPAALFYTAGVVLMLFTSARALITDNNSPTYGTHLPAFLAALGYFISSFFGVPMFYTLPFFFIFLGMSLPESAEMIHK